MARKKIPKGTLHSEPVLSTPPGAAPRGARLDPFEDAREEQTRTGPPIPAVPRQSSAPGPPAPPAHTGDSSGREWDFAMPATAPARRSDPHLDRDVNWRSKVGLRAPVEDISIPNSARERFNENWERLASEPPRPRRHQVAPAAKKSALNRWLYPDGHLDFGNAFGLLLLVLLLAAAAVYGVIILSGHGGGENPRPPAVQSP